MTLLDSVNALQSGHQPKTFAAGKAINLVEAGPSGDAPARFFMTLTSGTVSATDEYDRAVTFGGIEFPAFTLVPVCLKAIAASTTATLLVAW